MSSKIKIEKTNQELMPVQEKIKSEPLKILHTADWHLGVSLYNESLEEDHALFLNWLVTKCIPEVNPNVLIISGDVFDKANPSINARKQYFQFLANLVNLGVQHVIITAGNHDSPAMLEAPRELLEFLNIHIVGTPSQNHDELLILIKNKNDDGVKAVIAAVPYLRDQDVRYSQSGDDDETREDALKKGIHQYFGSVADATSNYRALGIPVICMGHLFASGVTVSDSERPVQIGNLADVGADCFPEEHFAYVALGHIHRAQSVQGSKHIWYSGSPIALSFSEWDQQKYIRLITIEGNALESSEIKIPLFRKLIRIKGNFLEVKHKIQEIKDKASLPSLLDIEIVENLYDVTLGREIAQWIEELVKTKKEQFSIASHRYRFIDTPMSLSSLSDIKFIEDLNPEEVLKIRLDSNALTDEDKAACSIAFHHILELVQIEVK